jgi:hypothetical protein
VRTSDYLNFTGSGAKRCLDGDPPSCHATACPVQGTVALNSLGSGTQETLSAPFWIADGQGEGHLVNSWGPRGCFLGAPAQPKLPGTCRLPTLRRLRWDVPDHGLKRGGGTCHGATRKG